MRSEARLVGIVGLSVVTWSALAASAPAEPAAVLQPVLTSIKETRRLDLVHDEDPSAFDRPGLDLVFELPLPRGVQLLEIGTPDRPSAVDSTGHDLTQIAESFGGRREYVNLEHRWDEDEPYEFRVHLTTPQRSAESIDLAVELEATTFSGVQPLTVKLTDQWQTLDERLFGRKVEARLEAARDGVNVSVRPGTVKDLIEDVVLKSGADELESGWTMWNEDEIDYSFQGKAAATMSAVVRVRRGLTKHPIHLELKGQRIP